MREEVVVGRAGAANARRSEVVVVFWLVREEEAPRFSAMRSIVALRVPVGCVRRGLVLGDVIVAGVSVGADGFAGPGAPFAMLRGGGVMSR